MKQEKKSSYREGIDGPFGPPPIEYKYRCPKCGEEALVNEAIIDAGIGMAKFQGEYYDGFMPNVGCPGCGEYSLEFVDES